MSSSLALRLPWQGHAAPFTQNEIKPLYTQSFTLGAARGANFCSGMWQHYRLRNSESAFSSSGRHCGYGIGNEPFRPAGKLGDVYRHRHQHHKHQRELERERCGRREQRGRHDYKQRRLYRARGFAIACGRAGHRDKSGERLHLRFSQRDHYQRYFPGPCSESSKRGIRCRASISCGDYQRWASRPHDSLEH